MLRIGTEQDGLRAAAAQPSRRVCIHRRNLVPLILSLQVLDSLLVQVINNKRRVRIVTVGVVHRLIYVAVVIHRGIPSGSSNQADGLHLRRWRKLGRLSALKPLGCQDDQEEPQNNPLHRFLGAADCMPIV